MAKETIADLKTRIAVLEEQLKTANSTNTRLSDRATKLDKKVSTLRGEIVEFKAERDRLVGYTNRVRDDEQPPERRQHERREPPPNHHGHMGHDSGMYGNTRERDEPWYE